VQQSRHGKQIATTAPAKHSGGGGGVPPLLIAAALLAAALGAGLACSWVMRSRRTRSLAPDARAAALSRELAQALGRLRRLPPPGETLLSIERSMRTLSGERVATYAAELRSSRFAPGSPAPPGPEERRAVRRALGSGHGLRGRLRALAAFPPGGPRP
jgi:hypothetical protein